MKTKATLAFLLSLLVVGTTVCGSKTAENPETPTETTHKISQENTETPKETEKPKAPDSIALEELMLPDRPMPNAFKGWEITVSDRRYSNIANMKGDAFGYEYLATYGKNLITATVDSYAFTWTGTKGYGTGPTTIVTVTVTEVLGLEPDGQLGKTVEVGKPLELYFGGGYITKEALSGQRDSDGEIYGDNPPLTDTSGKAVFITGGYHGLPIIGKEYAFVLDEIGDHYHDLGGEYGFLLKWDDDTFFRRHFDLESFKSPERKGFSTEKFSREELLKPFVS
jgi:hypothetical protein